MSSQSTADGRVTITVTFELGTNLDQAQVLVQNRVAVAQPRLPVEVQQTGVTVKKNVPDLLMVVHMISPDNTYDQLYISNYALCRFAMSWRALKASAISTFLVCANTRCGSGLTRIKFPLSA